MTSNDTNHVHEDDLIYQKPGARRGGQDGFFSNAGPGRQALALNPCAPIPNPGEGHHP